jgi:(E)-4-hydroxy-3-methylbut-2-enyl-diphosphate synthase
MVESALEFLRIAESHRFKSIILSMKSSNPKVMIEAYRLLVERMDQEAMHYPLHLGVTEAGDGEDGRIKGSIGIGSLLLDGLGDTIRVSLTEDSVYEIPVARAIADKAMSLWEGPPADPGGSDAAGEGVDPFHFVRRETAGLSLGGGARVGPEQPPRVIARVASVAALAEAVPSLASPRLLETPAEGLLVPVASAAEAADAIAIAAAAGYAGFLALELAPAIDPTSLAAPLTGARAGGLLVRAFATGDDLALGRWAQLARRSGQILAIDVHPADLADLGPTVQALGDEGLLFTLSEARRRRGSAAPGGEHALGAYRRLAGELRRLGSRAPIWIRNTAGNAVRGDNTFLSRLIEASFLTGGLLCDGLGDLVSIETEPDPVRSTQVGYNVLQGAGARISKTEFVACPSCGRTLFDLQTTTQRIRAQTAHLKGVKLAIMGCIVNGPGEMADADFGYVGGAPGKINLYVGKQCVQYNLPQEEADARLIALIKEHGKWRDPAPVSVRPAQCIEKLHASPRGRNRPVTFIPASQAGSTAM